MDETQVKMGIGKEDIAKATETLGRYKSGKARLETRVTDGEKWYQIQHNVAKQDATDTRPEPTSAWLFNNLMNKHADAMDNYPEPNVLPRERSDEGSAKMLSNVLPVVLERNGFEDTYSQGWWEKLKHGAAPYGVFWDKDLEGGLGDVRIELIDLLNIFWEPGISDIQHSRNLFIVAVKDTELLEQEYPELKGGKGGNAIEIAKYADDESIDMSDKSVVVDWYYKKRDASGRSILHFVKFVGETLLFASENEAEYANGWYEHGLYPVVFDVLFPEKCSPVGFGYIAVTHNPQTYIDRLQKNILDTAEMGTNKRWFVSDQANINLTQYADQKEKFVKVAGSNVDDKKLMEITARPLDAIYLQVLQMKIDEMKETSSNRDVGSGGTASGVTAAAAIAALQEAGNKTSRDMIQASYRKYTELNYLCIELMRQFYDVKRSFRITGEEGFVEFSNAEIRQQETGADSEGNALYRVPVFDVTIRPQKRSPYSRMAQNELAKELLGAGFFNPQRAQEVIPALDMMDFEGKENVVEYVKQGATLLNIVTQLTAALQPAMQQQSAPTGATPQSTGGGIAGAVVDAQQANMTGYGQRLAERATANMDIPANNAAPGV